MAEDAYTCVLLETPFGPLAIPPDTLSAGLERGRQLAGRVGVTEIVTQPIAPHGGAPVRPDATPEGLLDAEGMAALTQTPASWWAAAGASGRVPSVQIGRWRRFRPGDCIEALAGQDKDRGSMGSDPSTPVLGPAKRFRTRK